uniref:Uncharacterized protein n=1 Tax=Arion vulgaris TaxID=1028688 RepID=A0A0B6YY81_9EUPU
MDDEINTDLGSQSPGYDIGPDEDRNYPTERIPVQMIVSPINDDIQFQEVFIQRPPNGIFEEPLDETPSEPIDRPRVDNNRIDEALFQERNRLETFEGKWNDSYYVHPVDLARNGFFYTGPGDKVMCIFCLNSVWDWEPGDSVEGEHLRIYPSCPFARRQCEHRNVSENHLENMQNSLGFQMRSDPEYFGSSDYSDRHASFKNWPKSAPLRPDALADAGFSYLEKDDHVQCFLCGTILSNLQLGDDPWFEHAKQSPDCNYVNTRRGSEFVRQVHNHLSNGAHKSSSYETGTTQNTFTVAHPKEEQPSHKLQAVKPSQHGEVKKSHVDEDLRSPIVKAVMEVCEMSVEQMRKKLEQIRITKGSDYKVTTKDFEDLNQ